MRGEGRGIKTSTRYSSSSSSSSSTVASSISRGSYSRQLPTVRVNKVVRRIEIAEWPRPKRKETARSTGGVLCDSRIKRTRCIVDENRRIGSWTVREATCIAQLTVVRFAARQATTDVALALLTAGCGYRALTGTAAFCIRSNSMMHITLSLPSVDTFTASTASHFDPDRVTRPLLSFF